MIVKHMAIGCLIASLGMAPIASAKMGIYLGGQAGYAYSQANDNKSIKEYFDWFANREPKHPQATRKDSSAYLGGRVFLGWRFNDYLAVEGGYTLYGSKEFTSRNQYQNHLLEMRYQAETNAWDLVGIVNLPLDESNWNIYAKAGVAYLTNQLDFTVKVDGTKRESEQPMSGKLAQWRPVVGVGVGYQIPLDSYSAIMFDLSWTRVLGGNKTKVISQNPAIQIKSADANLVSLGIRYTFAWL